MNITPESSKQFKALDLHYDSGSVLLGMGRLTQHSKLFAGAMLNDVCMGGYSYCVGGTSLQQCIVGNYTSIAHNVTIALPHNMDLLTTSPVAERDDVFGAARFTCCEKMPLPTTSIGSDVWIGTGVVIKSGVRIGDGAIIGAGAIVTKDIPPFSVAVGNPARVIRQRFPEAFEERIVASQWFQHDWQNVTLPWGNREQTLETMERYLAEGHGQAFVVYDYKVVNGSQIALRRRD